MESIGKAKIYYTLKQEREYNYDHLILNIFHGREKSIQEKVDGTIGNKDGYYNDEARNNNRRWFESLIDQGYTYVIDRFSYGGDEPSIKIDWQVYQHGDGSGTGYCGAQFKNSGESTYKDLQAAARLTKKIGRAIEKNIQKERKESYKNEPGNHTFEDPTRVLMGLHSMGGRMAKVVSSPDMDFMNSWVLDTAPRMWLYSDSMWRTFEIYR